MDVSRVKIPEKVKNEKEIKELERLPEDSKESIFSLLDLQTVIGE